MKELSLPTTSHMRSEIMADSTIPPLGPARYGVSSGPDASQVFGWNAGAEMRMVKPTELGQAR